MAMRTLGDTTTLLQNRLHAQLRTCWGSIAHTIYGAISSSSMLSFKSNRMMSTIPGTVTLIRKKNSSTLTPDQNWSKTLAILHTLYNHGNDWSAKYHFHHFQPFGNAKDPIRQTVSIRMLFGFGQFFKTETCIHSVQCQWKWFPFVPFFYLYISIYKHILEKFG